MSPLAGIMPQPEMHVGLNLVYLVPGETGGMETYARELTSALMTETPGVRLTVFLSREAAEDRDAPWSGLPSVTVPVKARRRSEWVRGEQQLLPGLARRSGIDLLHSLASTAPVWGRFRRVVTIHDVIYRIYPEAHAGIGSRVMGVLVPLAARRSDRVIAPSAATRDDLTRLLHVPAGKIDVVPEGVRLPFGRQDGDANRARGTLGLGNRQIVLAVSAKRPHKNLSRLLEALALISSERRPILLMPGYATPWEVELHRRCSDLGLDADVRFLGWVSDTELEDLYAAADCFVFPSLYEGFGLPVLEAMARGVPVACSDRASLPEVAGGAARLFDPERPEEIARAIEAVLSDPDEAARLIAAGRERAARFTWQQTARATAEVYRRALAADPVP
jgi:glycosyltransferase involved in cell wall biosynthesis